MASKSLISLANIPVKDIANYMDIVEGFSRKKENAADTDLVAGIDANKTAVASMNEEGELINGRGTVDNALSLGGVAATGYLKKDESTTLLDDTYQVSTILSNEMREMRDEIYQLKSELAKQGYIKQNTVYDGFYDAFRDGEIRYEDEVTAYILGEHDASAKTITLNNTDNISIGEYIAIKDIDGNMFATKVEDIINKQIIIKEAFGIRILNETPIYKYAGSYYNGEFIFGKNTGAYVSTDSIKTIVKDGKERTVIQVLGEDTKGFATKLSNYYSTYGSQIRRVEFSIAYTGNPGSIRASIWKINPESEKSNPTCELLGTSQSVYPSSASNTLSEVSFAFERPIRIAEGSSYLVSLYCGGANENNTWRIGGYSDPYDGVSDLFYVDDTYYFNNETFNIIPGATDAYLGLYLSRELSVDIRYNNTGLYTCLEEIQGGFTRARVELKVNREGIYQVASDAALSTTANNVLKITGEKTNCFYATDQVVVGNMISKLQGDCTADKIQMVDNMYTPVEADVYRVGYKVQVKAKRKISDIPLVYGDERIVELPLVGIMKGKESNKEAFSTDRLIFEAEIEPNESVDRLLKTFDLVEVQVYWKSSLASDTINTAPQFAGKILDISVATDKSYNRKK